ncbi:MAG TPA: hypothetical protein DCF68_16020 [Cyanothece sp. UBA12306]|nr:hypothetical protein [Cyanothece sp. UBA12306]
MTVPIGTILPYGGLVTGKAQGQLEQQGYLICNGQAVSRTTYSELFTIIGGAYGDGDNINTFNLPDLRGRFVRGVDHGTGRDPDANSRTASGKGGNTGDEVGSLQEDEFKSHTHIYFSPSFEKPPGQGSAGSTWQFSITSPTEATGGAETRPKNIYVNWIIKAKDV